MKKTICLLLACFMLSLTALADVAWEPVNSFYLDYKNECRAVEREYWVNSEAGYVTVRKEPGGKPLVNMKNGTLRVVHGIYDAGDGEVWGLVSFAIGYDDAACLAVAADLDEGYHEGWVLMEDMLLRYDNKSFMEEYKAEIKKETRVQDIRDLRWCIYEYPGGEFIRQGEKTTVLIEAYMTYFYTDPEGREWGCLGGSDWLCVDDPENPGLQYTDHTPELHPTPDGVGTTLPEWTAEDAANLVFERNLWKNRTFRWTVIAVGTVCIVTAARIAYLKKKRGE